MRRLEKLTINFVWPKYSPYASNKGEHLLYEGQNLNYHDLLFPMQKAKKKPMAEVDPASLDLDLKELNSKLTVLSVEDPPVRESGSKVADVDELVSKLKEAGVV